MVDVVLAFALGVLLGVWLADRTAKRDQPIDVTKTSPSLLLMKIKAERGDFADDMRADGPEESETWK